MFERGKGAFLTSNTIVSARAMMPELRSGASQARLGHQIDPHSTHRLGEWQTSFSSGLSVIQNPRRFASN